MTTDTERYLKKEHYLKIYYGLGIFEIILGCMILFDSIPMICTEMYSVYFFIGGLVTSAFTIAAGGFGLRTGTNSNFVMKSLIMAMVSDVVVFVYLGFNVWAFMNWAFNEAYFTSKFLHCLVHGLQII